MIQGGRRGPNASTKGSRNRSGGSTDRKCTWETTEIGDGINTETRAHCIMRARPAGLITRWLSAACRWEDPQAGKRRAALVRQ
jgi:hypothetical protein